MNAHVAPTFLIFFKPLTVHESQKTRESAYLHSYEMLEKIIATQLLHQHISFNFYGTSKYVCRPLYHPVVVREGCGVGALPPVPL